VSNRDHDSAKNCTYLQKEERIFRYIHRKGEVTSEERAPRPEARRSKPRMTQMQSRKSNPQMERHSILHHRPKSPQVHSMATQEQSSSTEHEHHL
jgi:hypothetical protein